MSTTIFFFFFFANVKLFLHCQQMIRFDQETLNKLRLTTDLHLKMESYDEFGSHHDYQCAIECLKEKGFCTNFFFDSSTNLCSLYNDPTNPLNSEAIKYVSSLIFSSHFQHLKTIFCLVD